MRWSRLPGMGSPEAWPWKCRRVLFRRLPSAGSEVLYRQTGRPAVKPPAFQWYAKEWLTDDKRTEMSLAQRGAYADLLSYQWVNTAIPADVAGIARAVGVGVEEMIIVWTGRLVDAFPENGEGRRANPTLESYRVALQAHHDKRFTAGKKGAASRWDSKGHPPAHGTSRQGPFGERTQNDGPA